MLKFWVMVWGRTLSGLSYQRKKKSRPLLLRYGSLLLTSVSSTTVQVWSVYSPLESNWESGLTKKSRPNAYDGWCLLNQESAEETRTNGSYYQNTLCRCFALDIESYTCPFNIAILISVKPVAAGISFVGAKVVFNLLPPSNALSEFENEYAWSNLQDVFDYAIDDPTILLDNVFFFLEICVKHWSMEFVMVP